MKVREVIRLLEKHGWVEMRSKGSHRHFKHPEGVFVITVPGNRERNWPGCAAVGDTKEETRRNFEDALAAHFEAMREIGEPIPQPNSTVDYVEVAA
jgi:predicted RNA binding protein YcfA (HicA-like mRNA interferase family)